MRTLLSPAFLSRRNLLRGAGASLATLAGGASLLSSAAASTVRSARPGSVAVSAGQDGDRHMTIDVRVNGKGPFRFVVDTGAVRSVLSESVARELDLPTESVVKVAGVSGVYPTRTVSVHEIAFGSVKHADLEVPVLPDDQLDADGYLGLDVIDQYHVTFDFKRSELRVAQPRPLANIISPKAASVTTKSLYGGLRISNCLVDTVETTLFIDTGAGVTVGNRALMTALSETKSDFRAWNLPGYIDDVAGGTQSGKKVYFGKMQVGDVTFSSGTLLIADLNAFKHWGLIDRPALLLGMNFLRQFDAVSIDYIGDQFRFEVA